MKKLSAILSVIMVIVMLSSMFCVGTSAAAGDISKWDGSSDTSWYDPAKTQFTISTAAQLAGMGELSSMGVDFAGKSFKLVADIVLNEGDASTWDVVAPAHEWTMTIGTNEAPFKGNFDAQGHTISGLYINKPDNGRKLGLFGKVGDVNDTPVEIKNLNVTNAYVCAKQYSSAIMASVVGVVHVENCHVSKLTLYCLGDRDKDGEKPVSNVDSGAIVGYVNTATELIVSKCSLTDSYLEGYVRVGGIVGGGEGTYLEISDCYVASDIQADNRPGGILGHSSVALVEIKNCYFKGDIHAASTRNYGGIFGGFRAVATAEIGVHDCFYDGTFHRKDENLDARVGCTEIGVMSDDSTWYTPLEDHSNDSSSNDADGVEAPVTVQGAGALAAFVAKLDANTWDTTGATPKLKVAGVNETPFGDDPGAEDTGSEETTKAPDKDDDPNDTTKKNDSKDTTKKKDDKKDTTKATGKDDGGLSVGAIIGIVAGAVVVVAAAVVVAIILIKKKKNN